MVFFLAFRLGLASEIEEFFRNRKATVGFSLVETSVGCGLGYIDFDELRAWTFLRHQELLRIKFEAYLK